MFFIGRTDGRTDTRTTQNYRSEPHKKIYIIIKSSHQFTYKPKNVFTLYINIENFDVFNDLYKYEKEFKKKLW
jgi:hypothetical protein